MGWARSAHRRQINRWVLSDQKHEKIAIHLRNEIELELRDDASDLRNEFRTHEVERRVVEHDSTL